MIKRLTLPSLLAALLLTGAGCITIGSPNQAGTSSGDGGVFKSTNSGDAWTQKSAVPSVDGSKHSIGAASVGSLVQDPSDPQALYIGTSENGLWLSYDGGDSWRTTPQVSRGAVTSVAVDPKAKCTVYATVENKLVKTEDCTRTWAVRYLDSAADRLTTAVAVDTYNPQLVWLGNMNGSLFQSQDSGMTWKLSHAFDGRILRIVMAANDSRRIYVALQGKGIWRTDDGGANWKDLSPNYQKFAGSADFMDLTLGVSEPKLVLFASKFGILRSRDGGDTWEKVELLTPPGTTLIYSLAVDPRDPNVIYYGTATTFYRSQNGGVNWIPKKLPTSRAATVLLVDRSNSSVLYMGTTKFKQ